MRMTTTTVQLLLMTTVAFSIWCKVKVYQFQKAEAANRNTQNKFLCFAVCPPVVLVLGRPVKQWSSCGIGGHAVCRLLCILVHV